MEPSSAAIVDSMNALDPALPRCWWSAVSATRPDPLMVAYHDEEWGTPCHDDVELFERLALESFQAGLSWATILRKREGFRAAFRGFDPAVVARFDDGDRARLIADARIVRNRAKIDATIGNAAAWLATASEFRSVDAYLATIVPTPAARMAPDATSADVPATTPVSDRLSADLRRRGFRFVGSTIVYSFMQSVGLVDDHVPGCFRYTAWGAAHQLHRETPPAMLMSMAAYAQVGMRVDRPDARRRICREGHQGGRGRSRASATTGENGPTVVTP